MSGPILLTAGGTGGHVFPAEALAGELLNRGYPLALVTDRRIENFKGALGQIPSYRISAGGIAGRSLTARIRAVVELGIGFLQARRLLKRLAPKAVIGFGSYASLPAMLAATRAGIPTAIHEQNAVLGRANRLLAPRVSKIATSFAQMSHVQQSWQSKIARTGNPVRSAVLSLRDHGYSAPSSDGPVRILVLGGSQGARILSEVIPAALIRLPEAIRKRISLSQQCRPEDLNSVRAIYHGSLIETDLSSFFDDVPQRLDTAHLVISRSGASTVAELGVAGRPAILVPYQHATDDHQTANARAIDEAGGGWLIPQASFTAEGLASRLTALLAIPETLSKAASCARAFGTPDAASRLADLITGLADQKPGAAV